MDAMDSAGRNASPIIKNAFIMKKMNYGVKMALMIVFLFVI